MFKKIIEKLQYGSCKVKVDDEQDTTQKEQEKRVQRDTEK